jgi:hypothetical protein
LGCKCLYLWENGWTLTRQILYYQYVVKRGLNAPWTVKAKQVYDASGGEQHRKSQIQIPVQLI